MVQLLIVDDEPLVQIGIRSMLNWESMGIEIAGTATNGRQAYDIILEKHPEIVITDIKMPIMDGMQLIEKCQSQEHPPLFILLTSYEEFALVKQAISYQVLDYLVKLELTEDVLNAAIQKALGILEKERKQAEEKNRLYDLMQKQTAEQFQQIAGYVDQLEQCTDHREYHRLLGKILIVGSYLKRRKNLTLSALEGKELKEEELIQSLRESCSNLVFCEIQGQYYIETGKETLPAQLVLRAYDFFEQIVELLLKQGGSFFYRLTELNGVLRISVNLEGDCQTESLQEKYPLLHMEQEEEKEWFLALQLSEKGGNDEIL